MARLNLDGLYWDRIRGYVSEMRVDSRWILRDEENDKPYGSLRIVSHPDLPPGHLRSIFYYVINKKKKSDYEILQTIEDYQLEMTDLEIFSVDENIETEKDIYEAPLRELEDLYGIKVFGK